MKIESVAVTLAKTGMNQGNRHVHRRNTILALAAITLCSAAIFLTGIGWGLPSRNGDRFLFGTRDVWSGDEIARLAGDRAGDTSRGADVDVNPVRRDADQPVVLNDTDARRAEIIRRYRLYTYQPDEMITLMALASMHPGQRDFDPKLYQYGGLWIYPIGAMIRAASSVGLVQLSTSQAFYIEHPDAFARFYLVARLYVVLWGIVGAWIVFLASRMLGGGVFAAAASCVLYSLLPVVVNMSHEAKPHLPGAVLVLMTALAAAKYARGGAKRWWIGASVLAGMASGMILSGVVAVAALPLMFWFRRPTPWKRRGQLLAASVSIAICVYFATNPYVLLHLIDGGKALSSNAGNTRAMYGVGQLAGGIPNALMLIGAGTSDVVALAGVLSLALLAWKRSISRALAILLAPALLVFVGFTLLAAGKPGEYARFAIYVDIALAIAVIIPLRGRTDRYWAITLCFCAALPSAFYIHHFIGDSRETTRRIALAGQIAGLLHARDSLTIGTFDEPAPYLLPPVDVFSWRMVLLPRNAKIKDLHGIDVVVRAVDAASRQRTAGDFVNVAPSNGWDFVPTRISWADKPIEIWVRKDLAPRGAVNE